MYSNISMYSNLFPNYSFHYTLPKYSSIGGVGIFVHKSFTVIERDDLNFPTASHDYAELLFLEISKLNFHFLIGGFYRHPNCNTSDFSSNLECIFQSLPFRKFKFNCLLAGDFNLDLLKYDSSNDINNFISLLTSYNFLPYLSYRLVSLTLQLLSLIMFILDLDPSLKIVVLILL